MVCVVSDDITVTSGHSGGWGRRTCFELSVLPQSAFTGVSPQSFVGVLVTDEGETSADDQTRRPDAAFNVQTLRHQQHIHTAGLQPCARSGPGLAAGPARGLWCGEVERSLRFEFHC